MDLSNNHHHYDDNDDDDPNHLKSKPAHLDPSPLGTQAYWDETYSTELKNISSLSNNNINIYHGQLSHNNNGDDDEEEDEDDDDDISNIHSTTTITSTDWFSEHSATSKLVRYLRNHHPVDDDDKTTILDIGSGNGALLAALRRQAGFNGPMIGIDYSAASIALARHTTADIQPPIRFERWDVLHHHADPAVTTTTTTTTAAAAAAAADDDVDGDPRPDWLAQDFDIVLDKGTFDAVCLSAEISRRNPGRRMCEEYPGRVARLVKPDTGRLIVTSCCWTEEELRDWFEGGGAAGLLKACDIIEYPGFVFGGRKGNALACVVFYRPSSSSLSSSTASTLISSITTTAT